LKKLTFIELFLYRYPCNHISSGKNANNSKIEWNVQ